MKTQHIIHVSLILVMLAASISACSSIGSGSGDQDHQGTIAISGAWALYPLVIRWAEAYQELYPQVKFDISAGGAGKGMADTLAGAVDLGMVSREIYDEELEQGALGFAVAKDAVFLTVNSENPVWDVLKANGVTKEKLVEIFLNGGITSWGALIGTQDESQPIHVFTRSDACGAAETWAKYLGGKQEDLLGIGVYGDPGVLEAVIKDQLAIGYNNLNYAYDYETGKPVEGIHVVPLDSNGNGTVDEEEILDLKSQALGAVKAGIYPSPPARDLYLVTKGQPAELVRDFLYWALTDGQVYVDETGYIAIPQEKINEEISQLEG
jgi:phosphate transport system substrate-binding protein